MTCVHARFGWPFSPSRIFLRWLTVAKKKYSVTEKALVSLLENLCGWLGVEFHPFQMSFRTLDTD
jgi:hypothetical protein